MTTRIYALATACVVLTGLALVVPRFVPNQEGGLASAATAVMAFLAILVLATGLSVYLLVVTIRAYSALPWTARLAGIMPGAALVTALVILIGALRF